MQTITKEQLVASLTSIYQRYQDAPEDFSGYSTPEQDAEALVAEIFALTQDVA